MAFESATFFIDDYKGRHYKVHAVRVSGFCLDETLLCMVYRSLGIDDSPEWNRVYEEDYSADFCLYIEECLDLGNEREVETTIQNKFNDASWVRTWIDDNDFDEESECENQKEQEQEIVKGLLNEYEHIISPEQCAEVASKMAKFLKEKFC